MWRWRLRRVRNFDIVIDKRTFGRRKITSRCDAWHASRLRTASTIRLLFLLPLYPAHPWSPRPTPPRPRSRAISKERKYDRQLRLWGADCQATLDDTYVLPVNPRVV